MRRTFNHILMKQRVANFVSFHHFHQILKRDNVGIMGIVKKSNRQHQIIEKEYKYLDL